MSEFDKEAEREKLREKYAAEEQKRQATQRMSELLLRGATMTNQHCDTCGDPLFRYEGQVFCPTCQTGQAGQEGAASQATGGEGATHGATDHPEHATTDAERPGEPATDEAAREGSEATQEPTPSTQEPRPASQEPTPSTQEPTPATRERSPARDDTGGQSTQPTRRSTPWPDRPPADADLPALRETDPGDAPAELEAVVARLARRAAATEDPTQAREWLAAAREASEALAALRSTGQR